MPNILTMYPEQCIELSEKLHWFIYDEHNGEVNIVLDNHMMQTFRACESRFMLDFVEGWHGQGHFWFLDFGICVHTMIEYYYLHYRDKDFDVLNWAGAKAYEVWCKMNMDELYNSKSPWHHKNYSTLQGCAGFSALLMEYASLFHADNERFRVIGAELYFGKGKEVPLGTFANFGINFNVFLSGKIDLLMDDGTNIGPMDHKTSSNFGGKSPALSYEVHDGMIGYVYATKKLLTYNGADGKDYPKFEGRTINKMWMNFIQVEPLPQKRRDGTTPSVHDRYKRIPFFYSDYQLDQYRKRQVSTAKRITDLLIDPNLSPVRNTMMCTNYMRHMCSYHRVHAQNSKENELIILNSDFKRGDIWDPENRDQDDHLVSEE